ADLSNTPIILTDIQNEDSLLKMAKRAKVVINCCGPFSFMGEPVVKACIAAGTHHIDVSGEPHYMEKIQLEQDQNAKEKGVYVISACGFDSIPSDLGVIFMQNNFEGTLNSVETYLEFWEEKELGGSAINIGTWKSAVNGFAHRDELKNTRKKLFHQRLPSFYPKLKNKVMPHKSEVINGWILPFLGADRSVMTRTQRHFYEKESKRPIQVNTYFVVQSILHVIAFSIFGVILSVLSKFEYGRKLLVDYPEIFTVGMISKKEPSEEKIENSRFQITLYGQGWHERLEDELQNYTVPCNRNIVGRIKGKNPGYGSTCICLVYSAIVLLTENDKMPGDYSTMTHV
ncbi:Saccharopine dehydrogenase-like oxidoreductase, partial [Gonioctena quinquepunctata]